MIVRLLDDPALIQTEIDRRRKAAQKADPLRHREEETGTSSRGEEQRAPGDRLSGRTADSSPTTTKDAGIAETGVGNRIRTTLSEDGCCRRNKIPAAGREPRGIPQQAAPTRRLSPWLGVALHPQKTRVVHVQYGFEFLGYKIKRGKGLKRGISAFEGEYRQERYGEGLDRAKRTGIAPESLERFKTKLREMWNGCRSRTSNQLRDEWS